MKWLAIANPAAGRARDTERALARLRRTGGFRCEIVLTSARGDATHLARQAAGFDGLIVVGGDGTIAEVLHGMDLERQYPAVLPAGHGNCLARDLGVGDPDRTLASLQHSACRLLDLMEVRIGFYQVGTTAHQESRSATVHVPKCEGICIPSAGGRRIGPTQPWARCRRGYRATG